MTDSGCHCVSADHSSRIVGSDSVASSSELLLLGPVFETKAATSKSGNGVGRGLFDMCRVNAEGQFRGDGRTVRTLVFGVYKICCITGSYLWVIQKDITL